MADGYTLRIVSNHLPEMIAQLQGDAETIVQQTGAAIRDEAQANAPVLTGYLRDHIEMVIVGPAHVQVISQADYSAYPEFGTRFMAARPFFFPAVEHQWDAFVNAWRGLESLLK